MRIIFMSLLLGFFCSLLAIESSGFIKKLNGDAKVLRGEQIIDAKIALKIYPMDIIKTSKGSSLGIIFKDNTLISLGSNTEYIVEEYIFNPAEKKESFISKITKGTLTGLTGLMSKINPNAMKIKAKSASIGIRGTHFIVSVD